MENNLQIIFENKDFMVVNKQSGLTVNRSDTTAGVLTLQDLIEKNYKIGKNEEEEFIKRAGIVHRLDKETSGVIIVAKNSASFRALQAQFKERGVEKEYVALVHGQVKSKEGEIKAPVGRLPWNRKRFGVLAGGREAVTSYEVISNFSFDPELRTEGQFPISNEKLSLLRLYPKTGRTHQIRVHLKYINHPIFADELYGGRKTGREDRKLLDRIFLHAEKISFFDPGTGKKVSFSAPLPGMLTDLLEKLKNKSDN